MVVVLWSENAGVKVSPTPWGRAAIISHTICRCDISPHAVSARQAHEPLSDKAHRLLPSTHHQRKRRHWNMTGQRQALGGKHTGCKDRLTGLAPYLECSEQYGNDWAGMCRRLQASGYNRGVRVGWSPAWCFRCSLPCGA